MTDSNDRPVALSPAEVRWWRRESANDALRRWIFELFVAMNLAEPGAAQMLGLRLSRQGTANSDRFWPEAFLAAQERGAVAAWPSIGTLPLPRVWEWLQHLRGFGEGHAAGEAGRAVAALTRASEAGSVHERLMWAMVGLEALYTSGDSGLVAQMKTKGQLVLGSSGGAERAISEMYRDRSAFVHGKRDFGDAFGTREGWEWQDGTIEAVDGASLTACAMLVASIQVLIEKGWMGFRFGTTVEAG